MGLDSVELVIEIEKHFSISIPEREAEKAYTVGRLVDCVANIQGVSGYNFSLRENTFRQIKSILQNLTGNFTEFSLNDKVATSLDISNKGILSALEAHLNLKLPGVDTKYNQEKGLLSRVKIWLRLVENIDFDSIKWKKYIDILIAFNLDKLVPQIEYNSKYEIYLAVMRITVDKIGVDYTEIGIGKKFTDDLGVD